MRFLPRGDAAVLVDFGQDPGPATTAAIAAFDAAVAAQPPHGLVETVPGFNTLLLILNPAMTDAGSCIESLERLTRTGPAPAREARHWTIPVCYDSEFAPDLHHVAATTGLSVDAVIESHTAAPYFVYMLGFSPGFAYLGDLPAALDLPRRPVPRPRIEAGSVAIATRYTAIYPQSTAGGWHIIGRTPVRVFDAAAAAPTAWRSGDTVRFEAVDRQRYEEMLARSYRLGEPG